MASYKFTDLLQLELIGLHKETPEEKFDGDILGFL